ncbi:leucine-rich repeats and immunoglobulin-like domains protein 1 [Nylanderia fulva]|uniref:leucine-rich repeats and immunoglobulin-like domains protein 1 n=1 Tax=Nylanderia fulva TaxID=613905 RepID=UPI0010FAE1AB|nr:leucine-rich repeats and immunoglobulin-like domains protein 1 [Nylanderia fulva]
MNAIVSGKIAMLLFVVCLLPLVMTAPLDSQMIIETPSNLILDVRNGTLTDVRFIEGSNNTVVDMSNFSLRGLEKTAFDNVLDVESLILANNSLTSLPEFVFSNLSRLRSLSLSGNQISNLRNLFVGLKNLQLLDISRNLCERFWRGDLVGLTKSVKILTNENKFQMISRGMFANSSFEKEKPTRLVATTEHEMNFVQNNQDEKERKNEHCAEERDAEELKSQEIVTSLNEDTRIKICKTDGIVTTLAVIEKDEDLIEECVQVFVNLVKKQVDLREQDIRGFQENWYQLQLLPIFSLDLSSNNITEIIKETLNSLPVDLTYVNLLGNNIHRIRSQVIENYYLKAINLNNNLIDEIEEDAFGRTNLRELYVDSNQLKSFDFVSSLPDTLRKFVASGNYIASIPNGVFSKFSCLVSLNLDYNEIKALQTDVFQGLKSLQMLRLRGNNVMTIELSAFRGLTALRTIDLQGNSLRELPKNIFADLTSLSQLDLTNNNITKAMFADLPSSVGSLLLDYNNIEVLEEDNFVRVPQVTLSLTGNRIAKIKRGAFKLPTLVYLYLDKNLLTTIKGDSYEGLGRLKLLSLSENKISEIRKGACNNLGSLALLDISKNPFEKLENGALHGLNTDFRTRLYIRANNLKEIQGGVFDDL